MMRDWNGGATGQRQTGTVGDLKMEQQRNCTRTGTVGNSLNIFGYHKGVPVRADLLEHITALWYAHSKFSFGRLQR